MYVDARTRARCVVSPRLRRHVGGASLVGSPHRGAISDQERLTLMNEIISLLNTVSKLYSEFALNSNGLREYMNYHELFTRTEDYISQLYAVQRHTGTTPTADEAKEVIGQIMYDFIKSFTANDEIAKFVDDYEQDELLAIEASLT